MECVYGDAIMNKQMWTNACLLRIKLYVCPYYTRYIDTKRNFIDK